MEYGKINAELEDAFKSGVLKKRFVAHSFATAPVREILLRLPESVWEVAKKSFQTYPLGMDVGQEKELFDTVNLRRAALTGGGFKHSIQGWVFPGDPEKKIKSVISVAGSEQNPVTIAYMPRPDVAKGFKKNDWEPSVTGFRLSYYSSSEKVGGLLYLLEDGSTVLSDRISAGIQKIESQSSHGLIVNQGVDFATVEPALRAGLRHRAQVYLSSIANSSSVSSILMVMLLGLGVLSMALVKYAPGRGFQVSIFSFMVVALLALRIVFYAILESEAWGVEVRYMLTGNFMAAILIAVWLPFCIGAIKKLLQERARVAGAARY